MAIGRSITFRPCEGKLLFQTRDVLFQGDVLGPFVLELKSQFGKRKTPTYIGITTAIDATAAGVIDRNVWLLV